MDARVEPGGDGRGSCRVRLGDFTLAAEGGKIDRDRRGQARDPPDASTCTNINQLATTACRGWWSPSCSSARPRTSTSDSPPAPRCRRWSATTEPRCPTAQEHPITIGLPADALRVLPDPGISVANIQDETTGNQVPHNRELTAIPDRPSVSGPSI